MTATLLPNAKQQFLDSNGRPLAGGQVYFYIPNTSTLKNTWQDAGKTILNTNPVVLDASGQAIIYGESQYRQVVYDVHGNLIWDRLTDSPALNTELQTLNSQVQTLASGLASPSGSSGIGFLQSGTGAANRTVQEKGREFMTTLDFITDPAERLAIVAGTSTADHTVEIQNAINAAGSTHRLRWLGTVNTGALSSSASVDWVFEGGAKVKQIPAVYTAGSFHISLTGPNIRIENAEFDGNQDAMISTQGSNGLSVSGASPTLIGVKGHDYNGVGYTNTSSNYVSGAVDNSLRRGLHIGCSFDDNAGLGMNMIAATYHDFTDCTFDRNGYGFQKTRTNYADTSHGFVAFGVAVRMRSHHINFSSCTARDNGRDGFNCNQGSYAVKFAECLAHGNDDGGFTMAADNTGSGMPGEGEGCWDIQYIGCESYNNYTGGLVAYQACSNVRVNGGRYYDNNRVAGDKPAASSFFNGIYFAAGSNGIDVDATVYDERQFRVITAISSGTLTASGWVPGDMNYYPKVAIYSGSDQSFKGYGKITAESGGSVTITPTSNNGVTLGSISVGDYVTQAVQHNGVFADNNCQGTVIAAGAGHHFGVSSSTTGRLVFSGGFAGGQNILQPRERPGATELLANPTFDSVITSWTYNLPGGGASNYVTTAPIRSAGALQLIAGTSDAQADGNLISGALSAMTGEFVEFGVWSYASARNDAYIQLFWTIGSTFSTTVQHPGGGWRYLKIGAYIPSGSTAVTPRLNATAGKTVVYDSASLRAIESHMDTREFTFPTRSLPL